jgi:sulfide:quinone oxidoreductase
VAIEAPDPLRRRVSGASSAANQALWWPPAKIAGRYLAPYLATARPAVLAGQPLSDRIAIAGPPIPDSEQQDALELALLLADGDARSGDYGAALSALDAAEALHGTLPAEYEIKRRTWLSARRTGAY